MAVAAARRALAVRRAVAVAQRWITSIYRLELDLCAERFVVGADTARSLLPPGSPRSGVVVVEEADGVSLGLYLDPHDATDPHAIVEETSHVVYLAWLAGHDRSVSRLLLELQSEVDRYAVARLLGRDAMRHFSGFVWDDWMDRTTTHRYAQAHRSAHRYCRALQRRYPKRRDTPSLLAELRRYYRATPDQKLHAA